MGRFGGSGGGGISVEKAFFFLRLGEGWVLVVSVERLGVFLFGLEGGSVGALIKELGWEKCALLTLLCFYFDCLDLINFGHCIVFRLSGCLCVCFALNPLHFQFCSGIVQGSAVGGGGALSVRAFLTRLLVKDLFGERPLDLCKPG